MKYIFPLVMMLLFIGILVGANFYLSNRLAWIFTLEERRLLHIIFACIPIYMIGGMIGFSNTTTLVGSWLYAAAAILTGLMLYLVLSMLFIHLVHQFVQFKPMLFGLLVLSLTSLISAYGIWNATRTKVTQLEVPIKGLKQDIRVMHFSDIHIGHFRAKRFMQKLVDLSNGENPDILVITGDLFDGKIQLKKENLSPLKQIPVPIFFVEGNHDGYSGVNKIKDILRETGVKVLENEVTLHEDLQIIGLNHMRADSNTQSMHANPNGKSIKGVLSELKIDDEKPALLLHHSPDGIEYAHQAGIELYLSGHTHAGQLFPVNYLNDLLFRYNKGLSDFKDTKIFVSQGVGTFGPPMRIGTKSEIVLLTLISE